MSYRTIRLTLLLTVLGNLARASVQGPRPEDAASAQKRQYGGQYYNIDQCVDSVVWTPPPSSYAADDFTPFTIDVSYGALECNDYPPGRDALQLINYNAPGPDNYEIATFAGDDGAYNQDGTTARRTFTFPGFNRNDFYTGGYFVINYEFGDSNFGSTRIADYFPEVAVPLDATACQNGLSLDSIAAYSSGYIRMTLDIAPGPCGAGSIFTTNSEGFRAIISALTPNGWLDIATSSSFVFLNAYTTEFQIELEFNYIDGADGESGLGKRDRQLRVTLFSQGGDIVVPFSQADNAPIIENAPPATYSQLHVQRKRDIAAGLVLPSEFSCGPEQRACPIGGRDQQWECVSTMTDINSCGGCWGEPQTLDCSALDHVEEVSCVQGECRVLLCETEFIPALNGSMCEQLL